MEHLEHAISVAEALKCALDAEVERAQGERILVRNFDVDGLFKRAAARDAWNGEVVKLQQGLAAALREAGVALGLAEVSMEALAKKAPLEAAQLADVLGQVRALAGALAELDELNRKLATKAMTCVKGYLQALAVSTSGYDRRGTVANVEGSTFSRTA